MENTAIFHLRAFIIICTLCSTLFYLPELSPAPFRPFLLFWLKLRQRLQYLTSLHKSRNRERFWEIDMTKFEP
jgi:hypothetical protein